MKAMILAAGRGTRLGPLGRTLPKVLVDVGGEPLLAHHLRYLEGQGIRRVVVNAHHLADQIEGFVERYDGALELTCVVEERLLGTAGGVRNALPLLEPRAFAVIYGDVVLEEPLAPLFAKHRESSALATLAVHEADDVEGKGVVRLDSNGGVTAFVEKGGQRLSRGLVNSGVYILESRFVATIPSGVELDFGKDIFPHALEQALPIFGHRLTEPVIDIGTPEGLEQARRRARVHDA